MFYVTQDGSIEVIEDIMPHHDLARCFGTMVGASRHADAPPVTPVFIDTQPVYAGSEVLANGMSVTGLRPTGFRGVYIESFPTEKNPRGREMSPGMPVSNGCFA